ncbi:MAG: sensor histidine kinase KdpD [Anaerolineaceae bacterium]|nr:sensor histidine kinase KdpD [Anaerolineaceae bacterium]
MSYNNLMLEEFHRPDPDRLLTRLQTEQSRQNRGQLKIFLGYAAGVGKTYAMLEAAHQRLAEGVDVVIGYVETHRRAETDALVHGLEVIPRKPIEYRGTLLEDMDVDAILVRHPAVVLIDELAHTNSPGMRHPKRYLDVEEILTQGISVYATLNIQHIESLNDVIRQITGVTVRETIPDRIVDQADEIELIDLAPDELLNRLKEGKVYIPDQAARAVQQFFRKGNLTALREISFRRAADRVDEQMLDYMEAKAIPGPWAAKERILVAVSSHPLSERLVRTGRRLADNLNAEWFAVYIETPDRMHYSASHSERVQHTLRLAEELGAKVTTISGRTVPDAVLEYAHAHNITKIIVGKPLRPRWLESLRGSIVDEIIRDSGPIDIYVMSDPSGPVPKPNVDSSRPHRPFRRYFFSALLVGAATLISVPLQALIHPTNLVMIYLAAVVVAALYLGRGPAMMASLMGVLAFDFFFIAPRLTFSVYDTQFFLTFIGLLIVGLIISSLTSQVRDQVEVLRQREARTSTLYSLSRDLTTALGLEAVLQTIVGHIATTISRDTVILLPNGETLEVCMASPGFTVGEDELAVARWAYQHGQSAGHGTSTLPAAAVRYLPLKTTHGVVGILGARPGPSGDLLNPEQREFLDAYANLAALAIERAQLDDQASQAHVLRETEKLQTALLNSISHDLRTPLASVTGALDNLLEAEGGNWDHIRLDHNARLDLLENAKEQADRLNRLVGNLLEMTRLEAGALKMNRIDTDLHDLIGAAIASVKDRTGERSFCVEAPEDLPPIQLDFVLIEQVFVNLLDNAAKYSEPPAAIDILARIAGDEVEVTIRDRGIGIPEDDLEKVFNKFYRVQRPDATTGTGLGLSICKGIIEAHGGRIWASNHPDGGAQITFSLPIGKADWG